MVQPAAFFGEAISLYSLAKTPSNGQAIRGMNHLRKLEPHGKINRSKRIRSVSRRNPSWVPKYLFFSIAKDPLQDL